MPQVLAAPARVSVGAERRRWRRAEGGRAGPEKAREEDDEDAVVVDVDIADVDGLICFLFFCFDGAFPIRCRISEALRARS